MKNGLISKIAEMRKLNFSTYSFNRQSKFLFLGALFLVAGNSSCKLFSKKQEVPTYVVYPKAPDPPRIQFLTKISSAADIEKKQSKFSEMLIGKQSVNGLIKPYGIFVKNAKLYICDNFIGGLEIIDFEKKKMQKFAPAGAGSLRLPINCFVDEKNYLYVADAKLQQVLVYNEKGGFIIGIGEKEKFRPTDVNVYDNKIFITNALNSQVCVYSRDTLGKLLYTIPRKDDEVALPICMPVNITISKGKVYVADFGCSQIKIYNTEGVFIDTIGASGNVPGTFSKLKGVAVDSEGIVYAVDAAFDNVQMFNKEKELLMDFGGHFEGDGGLILPAKVIIDYDNVKYFQQYVDPSLDLKYLVFVTSQYGPNLINVYGRVEKKVQPPAK